MSVQFDSTELQNSSYVPRSVKHDSAPDRELEIIQLAREDGGVLASEKYDSKSIVIEGVLKASTQSALETLIDNFKELMSRKNKNLDISYAGSTRRYIAYSRNVVIERDFFHLLFAPYRVEFIVPLGIGKDTAATAALDAVSADPPYSGSVVLAGTAEQKPVITLTIGAGWSLAYGIKFENTDTDEECIITRSAGFTNADVLVIDCESKKVTLNAVEIPFYRVLPSFKIGSNAIAISAGAIIDQQFAPASYTSTVANIHSYGGAGKLAQSFTVPHADATYQGISARVKKSEGTDMDLSIRIETDSAGFPSGTLAHAEAYASVATADIGTSFAWVTAYSTNKFSLSANTKYWIVMTGSGGTTGLLQGEYVSGTEATYGKGNLAWASPWTHIYNADVLFKLLFGGKNEAAPPTLTLDIDYTKRYL